MRILITGGAASGKSAFAEQRALGLPGSHVYLATMPVQDAEDKERVQRHRELRADKGFASFEAVDLTAFERVAESIPADSTVLLEDLGNLVSNTLFDASGFIRDVECAYQEIAAALEQLGHCAANLVVVGNEVGACVEDATPELHAYIKLLGRIACEYAATCDEVIEIVCGIPKRIK